MKLMTLLYRYSLQDRAASWLVAKQTMSHQIKYKKNFEQFNTIRQYDTPGGGGYIVIGDSAVCVYLFL